jgi:LmbE family N-acetylglucosaminyl deacetylase
VNRCRREEGIPLTSDGLNLTLNDVERHPERGCYARVNSSVRSKRPSPAATVYHNPEVGTADIKQSRGGVMRRGVERRHGGQKASPVLEVQFPAGLIRLRCPGGSGWVLCLTGVRLLAMALIACTGSMAFAESTIVYSNDFEAKTGSRFPEWSSSRIRYSSKFNPPGYGDLDAAPITIVESPRGKQRFLGEFGGPRIDPKARTRVRQSVRLKVNRIPRHTEAEITFDLLVLKSWDGSSPQYGSDRWSLKVEDGPTLIDTTFSNNPKLDSDKSFQDYPRPGSPPRSGSATANTLGYDFFGDSVYHFNFKFPHTADALTLDFASDLFEGKGTGDESWGLDNVTVEVNLEKAQTLTGPSVVPVKPQNRLKVVVFGGHPDDPESGAGGLIATLTRHGHEVILAYGTVFRGGRRFFERPEAEVRREEATAACKVLGASAKFFPYAHEALVADEPTLKAVSAWLDEVRPDVVVTHWPLDTHPNHHAVSSLVWQCYKRRGGWNLYFFEVMTDQQTIAFRPEQYLDIGPVREVKRRALGEHKSQSPDEIWSVHETMHRRRGSESGVEYAEAYSLVEAKKGCSLLPVSFLRRKGNKP